MSYNKALLQLMISYKIFSITCIMIYTHFIRCVYIKLRNSCCDIIHTKKKNISNLRIPHNAKKESGFKWSCQNGHFHVAQWLINTYNDININGIKNDNNINSINNNIECINNNINDINKINTIDNNKINSIDNNNIV